MKFNITAEKAYSARADMEMASAVILFAQEARMIASRGEMTPEKRIKLLEMYGIALDHPRLI